MMTFRNFTPHQINLNDGRSFDSEGIARVSVTFTNIENDVCDQLFGDVIGLPEQEDDVFLIVSGMVLSANETRNDLVAPATGHSDTLRNDRGHIISVPGFVR